MFEAVADFQQSPRSASMKNSQRTKRPNEAPTVAICLCLAFCLFVAWTTWEKSVKAHESRSKQFHFRHFAQTSITTSRCTTSALLCCRQNILVQCESTAIGPLPFLRLSENAFFLGQLVSTHLRNCANFLLLTAARPRFGCYLQYSVLRAVLDCLAL